MTPQIAIAVLDDYPVTAASIQAARAAQQAERAQFTAQTGVDLDQDGAIVFRKPRQVPGGTERQAAGSAWETEG